LPPEQVPNPAQSEVVLHARSSGGETRSSTVSVAGIVEWSA
jgi:hypothetical protein